ncbi:MAG: hypothetical protein AB7I48_17215 [Planctomycetaceae bacterium]
MNDSTVEYWKSHRGSDLAQGDYLRSCLVPVVPRNLSTSATEYDVNVGEANLIVITQSCDLANDRAEFVALCPILPLSELESQMPQFKRRGAWEEVRKGRREGLHMLAGPDEPQDNRNALVVDFRQIYSLPFEYLSNHASQIAPRWRLQSPFLEHFSQAFARFFMRVGLPSAIPPFK